MPARTAAKQTGKEWQSAATRDRLDAVTGSEPCNEHGVPLAYYGDYHAKDRTEKERRLHSPWEIAVDLFWLGMTGLFCNGSAFALGIMYLDSWGFDFFQLRDQALDNPWIVGGATFAAACCAAAGYGITSKKVKDRYYNAEMRAKPDEWKCQPRVFLSKEREREEFVLGCFNAGLGTCYAACLGIAKMKYGYSALYFDVFDYGIVWYVLSLPACLLWIEVYAYFLHRFMHTSFMYPHFHKIHHRYQPPTPASAVAQHPVEWTLFTVGGQAFFWVCPVHVTVALVAGMMTIYELILAHSGAMMTPGWFWEPSTKFHDDHHRYFHCNFGQHTMVFDEIFKTTRIVGRAYAEDVFGGKGKALDGKDEVVSVPNRKH